LPLQLLRRCDLPLPRTGDAPTVRSVHGNADDLNHRTADSAKSGSLNAAQQRLRALVESRYPGAMPQSCSNQMCLAVGGSHAPINPKNFIGG
jgi:hypothetical protein